MENMMKGLIFSICLCVSPAELSAQTASMQLQNLAKQAGVDSESKKDTPPIAGQAVQIQGLAEPPSIYSKTQIATWINEERQKVGSKMEFELLETKDWSDYVNYHHFVSLTYEGVPADYRFNYSWPGNLDKQTRIKTIKLPSAEVTETGKFMMWWDRCNFYQLDEQECKAFIHMAVTHEGRHFVQWQAIAHEAIKQVTGTEAARPPMTIEDFSQIPGVKDVFMRKWADGPHYQCREVEVYTAQILTGEMSEEMAKPRLGRLADYYKDCKKSQWKNDFQLHLDNAVVIFNKYNFTDY